MFRKSRYFFSLLFAVFCFAARAQESMLPDVDYAFLDTLIKVAKENYPKMKAFQHRIRYAENNVKKNKAAWFDAVSFSYLYSPNNSTTIVNPTLLNGYQFGIFVNLGTLLQRPFAVKMARDELAIAHDEKEEYDVNIEAAVKERYFLYVQQLTLLKVKSQAALDMEGMTQEIRYKFEKGEETFENYSKILVLYADHTQAKIAAEADFLIAKSSLEELLGKKLEEIQ